MPRLASLWLPNLPIDRLLRVEGIRSGRPPDADQFRALDRPAPTEPEPGARIEDCSCPRGGGWRPGARWAREDVEALPLHQRPPIRELGRRTEAADVAFKRIAENRASGPVKSGEHPLVTASRVGNRLLVAAACPAAQALGLTPGMPVTQARVLVPGLDVRDAEPEKDAALLARLGLFAARRWTPRAAVSGPDGLFLDLSGVAHLFGGERRLCARILAFCARLGLAARIAVAGTFGAAHALARHGGEAIRLCPSGREAEALAPLPLGSLRLDDRALATARRLGLETVADLIAKPRGPLNRRFGQSLLDRLDQALGRKPEPIDPIVPEEPPAILLRFMEPIGSAEAIEEAMAEAMRRLIPDLEKKGLAARALTLLCQRVDNRVQAVRIGTARATRDGAHLLRLLKPRIESIDPGFGIERMRLVADRVEPLDAQPIESPLSGAEPAPDLVPLVDRLAGRLGARRLYRMSAVESDVPERSLRRVEPLGQTEGWPDWPRPVRLLSPPERLDNVVALLPDQPPRRFTWRGQTHCVRAADGPERIHGEWWKKDGEADAVRDYFQVEDEAGERFWLYRRGDGVDARTGDLSWWIQGAFG